MCVQPQEAIADHVDWPIVVINKSTVPVGTGDWVGEVINQRRSDRPLILALCPTRNSYAKAPPSAIL